MFFVSLKSKKTLIKHAELYSKGINTFQVQFFCKLICESWFQYFLWILFLNYFSTKVFVKYSFLLTVHLTIARVQKYAVYRKDTTFKNSVKLKFVISEKKCGYPAHRSGSRQHTLTVTPFGVRNERSQG